MSSARAGPTPAVTSCSTFSREGSDGRAAARAVGVPQGRRRRRSQSDQAVAARGVRLGGDAAARRSDAVVIVAPGPRELAEREGLVGVRLGLAELIDQVPGAALPQSRKADGG